MFLHFKFSGKSITKFKKKIDQMRFGINKKKFFIFPNFIFSINTAIRNETSDI